MWLYYYSYAVHHFHIAIAASDCVRPLDRLTPRDDDDTLCSPGCESSVTGLLGDHIPLRSR